MSIKESVSADLKEAMKARDQLKVDTLRSVLSAMTYKRTELQKDLSAEDELAVVQKQVKQRHDSMSEFGKAGRQTHPPHHSRDSLRRCAGRVRPLTDERRPHPYSRALRLYPLSG